MTPSFARKSEPFASSTPTARSLVPSMATRSSMRISLKPSSPPGPQPTTAERRNTTAGRRRSVLTHDPFLGEQAEEVGERPLDVGLVLRLERQLDRVLRVADLRVRAEQQLGERR